MIPCITVTSPGPGREKRRKRRSLPPSLRPAFTEVSAAPEVPAPPEEKPRGLGALKGLFGGNIKLPEFNADTILLLVLVYFLVADDSENISDTLLIVGVLLLLGF